MNSNQMGMIVLLLIIGVTSIIDDHLSKSWLIAKVLAVAVLSFGLGMSYATNKSPKKEIKINARRLLILEPKF
jgi:hypothetical protein